VKLWYIEQRSPPEMQSRKSGVYRLRITRYVALADTQTEALVKVQARAAHAKGEWEAREYGADVVPLGMVRGPALGRTGT